MHLRFTLLFLFFFNFLFQVPLLKKYIYTKKRRKLKLSSFQIFAVLLKLNYVFLSHEKYEKLYIPYTLKCSIVGNKKKSLIQPGVTFFFIFLGFVRAFKWWRFACFFIVGGKTCFFVFVTIEVSIIYEIHKYFNDNISPHFSQGDIYL